MESADTSSQEHSSQF